MRTGGGPVEEARPLLVASLLDSGVGEPRWRATDDGMTIQRVSSSDASSAVEAFPVDRCHTGSTSGFTLDDACCPALVDALMAGQDSALVVCGGSSAEQHSALIGSGLLSTTAARLFERLREPFLAPNTRRVHEVRVSCALVESEALTDLLGPPPSDTEPAPKLQLKRSAGRRGMHISGLRAVVAASAREVEEAFAVGDIARRALAPEWSHAVFEIALTQRIAPTPPDPLAHFTSAIAGSKGSLGSGCRRSGCAREPRVARARTAQCAPHPHRRTSRRRPNVSDGRAVVARPVCDD
jgi:hypothetical protein